VNRSPERNICSSSTSGVTFVDWQTRQAAGWDTAKS
jgi:hypothetical protein